MFECCVWLCLHARGNRKVFALSPSSGDGGVACGGGGRLLQEMVLASAWSVDFVFCHCTPDS
eukprot:8619196-Alexandrium_andersonii.AAC.1